MNWYIRKTSFKIWRKKIFPFCLFCYVLSKWHHMNPFFPWLSAWHYYLYLCLNHLCPGGIYCCTIWNYFYFFQLLSQLPQTFQFINIAQLQFFSFGSSNQSIWNDVGMFPIIVSVSYSIHVNKIFAALQICIVFIWKICRSTTPYKSRFYSIYYACMQLIRQKQCKINQWIFL